MVKSRVSLKNQAVKANNGLVGFITGRTSEGLYSFEGDSGVTVVGLSEKQFKKVSPKYRGRKQAAPVVSDEKKPKQLKTLGNLKVKAAFKSNIGMVGEDFYVTRVGVGRNRYKVYAARRPDEAATNPSKLFVDWFHLDLIESIDEAYPDAYVLYCNKTRLKEVCVWAKEMNFVVKGDLK